LNLSCTHAVRLSRQSYDTADLAFTHYDLVLQRR
jgi:hypothetical protein